MKPASYGDGYEVGANYFMTYHTITKTSEDYYKALGSARKIADNITLMLNDGEDDGKFTVFPYRY